MERPQPISELVAVDAEKNVIEIYTASADAQAWALSESALFGAVVPPFELRQYIMLCVAPNHDKARVLEYLRSYGS
jgi:hypothetical protein